MSNYVDIYVKNALSAFKAWLTCRSSGSASIPCACGSILEAGGARADGFGRGHRPCSNRTCRSPPDRLARHPLRRTRYFRSACVRSGRLTEASQFDNIILKPGANGALVRLKDVGRAELGAEDYSGKLRYNGYEGIGIGVRQLPTANALDVDKAVKEEMARLSQRFPPGMKYAIAFDSTTLSGDSIREVLKTLVEAIVFVMLVMFLFLQDWRTTLIPAITIPVSLIGTFAFIKLLGFSINTLTLFGIVLATGLVVDDAIVVIENIQRHMGEEHLTPTMRRQRQWEKSRVRWSRHHWCWWRCSCR